MEKKKQFGRDKTAEKAKKQATKKEKKETSQQPIRAALLASHSTREEHKLRHVLHASGVRMAEAWAKANGLTAVWQRLVADGVTARRAERAYRAAQRQAARATAKLAAARERWTVKRAEEARKAAEAAKKVKRSVAAKKAAATRKAKAAEAAAAGS